MRGKDSCNQRWSADYSSDAKVNTWGEVNSEGFADYQILLVPARATAAASKEHRGVLTYRT